MTKILVADDDPGIRGLCSSILTSQGFQVLEAGDAAACLELVDQEAPDLILLDWMMPEVDGLDTLKKLKSRSSRKVPVVMMTALGAMPDIWLATFNGADGYVTKPFKLTDLLTMVRRFTEQGCGIQAAVN